MWDNNIVVFPFILFPDGWNAPFYRRITGEDMDKWRQSYKVKLHVVIGKGRVEVIALSDIAAKCKTTVNRIILVAEQQGHMVLGWEQYRKLTDEVGKLISGDEDQNEAAEPSEHIAHVAVGIPVIATESTKEAKILSKDSPA